MELVAEILECYLKDLKITIQICKLTGVSFSIYAVDICDLNLLTFLGFQFMSNLTLECRKNISYDLTAVGIVQVIFRKSLIKFQGEQLLIPMTYFRVNISSEFFSNRDS